VATERAPGTQAVGSEDLGRAGGLDVLVWGPSGDTFDYPWGDWRVRSANP
jgi:hypothetical protein